MCRKKKDVPIGPFYASAVAVASVVLLRDEYGEEKKEEREELLMEKIFRKSCPLESVSDHMTC